MHPEGGLHDWYLILNMTNKTKITNEWPRIGSTGRNVNKFTRDSLRYT